MKVFVTDGEGPVTKNDNAFELTSSLIPGNDETYNTLDGGKFYSVVSSYDDILAYLMKRPKYKAGDTLKLILPFLKAFGADDAGVSDFSTRNVMVMPRVQETLQFISDVLRVPSYIISTSYVHYVEAFCKEIGFPTDNVYCTLLEFDRYPLPTQERERLKALCREIAEMPVIEMSGDISSLDDLPQALQKAVQRLDEIFWEELPKMEINRIIEDVNPIGGYEKANALKQISENRGVDLSECVYYGDSITDVDAFNLTNKAGGLTVSFNGNLYAVSNTQIAVLAYDTIPISLITEAFCRYGKNYVIDLAEDWGSKSLVNLKLDQGNIQRLLNTPKQRFPKIYALNKRVINEIAQESTTFRKEVRGERVGGLG